MKYISSNKAKIMRLEMQIEIINDKLKLPHNLYNQAKMINAIKRREEALEFINNHKYTLIKWTEIEERFQIQCW